MLYNFKSGFLYMNMNTRVEAEESIHKWADILAPFFKTTEVLLCSNGIELHTVVGFCLYDLCVCQVVRGHLIT